MKKIQSVDDCLKLNGTILNPTFSEFPDPQDREYYHADWQWSEIAKAYNKLRDEKFKADYRNDDQEKYYPVGWLKEDKSKPTGFGFSDSGYNYTRTITRVGSRHAFAHPDDAVDAIEKFEQIYIRTKIY